MEQTAISSFGTSSHKISVSCSSKRVTNQVDPRKLRLYHKGEYYCQWIKVVLLIIDAYVECIPPNSSVVANCITG